MDLLQQGYDALKAKYIIGLLVISLATYGYMRGGDKKSTVDTDDVEVIDVANKLKPGKKVTIDALMDAYGSMEIAPYKKLPYNLKKKPMGFSYTPEKNPPKLEFIKFPTVSEEDKIRCRFSPDEKIIRCLRRKPITDAVEDRYGIPRGLLLAMMAQEGMGDPTLPNVTKYGRSSKNDPIKITMSDGGVGLLHIQAWNALEYGAHVYMAKKLKHRAMADYGHGKQVFNLYYKTDQNLGKLIEADDRFHPLASVDLAARFLCNNSLGSWEEKIISYHTGVGNRHIPRGKKYLEEVLSYRTAINAVTDQKIPNLPTIDNLSAQTIQHRIQSVEKWKKDMKVKVDGKEGGYEEYMEFFEDIINKDYKLSEYKKLKK